MRWKESMKSFLGEYFTGKLLRGMKRIGQATLEDLEKPEFVAGIIRDIGLRSDRRGIYGGDSRYMNRFGPGLWQIPNQLAGALTCLSRATIRSALEIGTCDGWTGSVIAAYLRRFQPDLRFVTVDIAGRFCAHERVDALVPIEYHSAASAEICRNEQFDLVFIDGNHDYDYVARDFELVGHRARFCMFHDIDDLNVGAENVPRFWRELKVREKAESRFHEFLGPRGTMGIGIRERLLP